MIHVSPDISAISPYIPGKSIQEIEHEFGISGVIKMASNENPLGPSKKALQAIRNQLKEIYRYPSGTDKALKQALANKWKLLPEQVIIGNGSNEIIELLIRTFIMPGDEVVTAKPTFSLYRLMAQTGHSKVIATPLKDGQYHLSKMAQTLTPKTRLVFICNPNNPTGTFVQHKALKKFLAAMPKRILVVFDEAYAEYATHPAFPRSVTLLKEGAPLIVLRTFSKIYGLAGLRIGYGLSHPRIVGYMNRVRQPFNTSLLAHQGALAALSDEGHLSKSRKLNREGKQYITRQFDDMGISYYPSEANFIYFNCPGNNPNVGKNVQQALLKKGVIIRHFESVHLRVTIGLPRENRRFIRSLKEVLTN